MTNFRNIIRFQSIISSEQNETINKSILFHGKQRQQLCFVEELTELLKELMHNDSNRVLCTDETLSEIADVVVYVEDIKILYGFHNSQFNIQTPYALLGDAITDMLIAISHYERNRIDETTYKGMILKLYMSIEEYLEVRYGPDETIWEKMNQLLDEKFEKFKSQIDKEMKNVRED